MAQPHLALPAPLVRYLRRVEPLHFPESAEMPESRLHMDLRGLLYALLREHLGGDQACFGSDQFVYWDAGDPRKCLAPDGLVKLGVPDEPFPTWQTWVRGAPDVAVEIVSESDRGEAGWADKLQAYRSVGVVELVRFDGTAPAGRRLRQWERVDHDLVERVVEADCARSVCLDLCWVVAPTERLPLALRITRGREQTELVPTPAEARRVEAEARRVEAEGRRAAEAEVVALRAELERLRRG